jgi:hypothetical protein
MKLINVQLLGVDKVLLRDGVALINMFISREGKFHIKIHKGAISKCLFSDPEIAGKYKSLNDFANKSIRSNSALLPQTPGRFVSD